MDKNKALKNLLKGKATKKEIESLQQAPASGEISISGDVNQSVIILGSSNTVGYTAAEVSTLIQRITSTLQAKPFDGRCPYKGLDVFEEEDAELFFGREKLVDDLVSRVKESRTVFVTGPSGSGKSSLVRAGLIHALRDGAIQEMHSERWLYEIIKPGRDPLETLASALSRLKSPELGNYFRQHVDDANILHECAESAVSGQENQRLVLFIDQFEEVFTQVSRDKTEKLIKVLTDAAAVESGRVVILFAMRSDFVSNCALYAGLNDLYNQSKPYLVGSMKPEELVNAIAQPALRFGLKIDPDLIAQVINDMKGEPGALPLMQFALKDLFDAQQAKGGVIALTLNDYLARGGIQKSLERHADAAFSSLGAHEQELARSIFSGLIEVGRGTQDTKRTALFDELVPANTNSADVETTVRKLADARLVTTDEAAGKDTVTISHEKLIDAWPWLKKLVNENRDVIALQNDIASDAKEWNERKRDTSYLYSGSRLGLAQEQVVAKKILLSGLAKDFIDEGLRVRDAERKSKEVLRRRITTGLVSGIAIALILAGFAVYQMLQAQKQAKISRIGELAAQSVSLRDKNFQISLLLGVEAINEMDEDIPSVQAQSVLLENSQTNPRLEQFLNGNTHPVVSAIFSPDGKTLASGTYGEDIILWDVKTRQPIDKLTGHTSIIRSIAFNSDGSIMASGSQDNTIILWDMKTRQLKSKLSGHSNFVLSVAFSPDGKMLASGSEDKTVMLWNVKTGQPTQTLSRHSDIVRSVAFSPDGKTLASGGDDGKIILWDVKTGEIVGEIQVEYTDPVFDVRVSSPVRSVAFSPDGKTLASGDYNKNVTLWDVKTGQPTQTLSRHSDIVISVTFSPDGKTLASGSADRTIILWDVKTGEPHDQLRGQSLLINSLSFSPDGGTLASGSGDTTIILWDINLRRPLSRSLTHFLPILSIAFSPDGKTLASGGYDQTITLWDVEKGQSIGNQPLIGHTNIVRSVAFSPDGKTLASGSYDQTIILWNVDNRQAIRPPLSGHSAPVTSVAFSPNGKTLASGSEDATVKLWDVEKHQAIATLSGHSTSVNSVTFSPDGRTLASGSGDGSIMLWDVMTHQAIVSLRGHSVSVNSVSFSPDGKTLASGSDDRSIILWDVKTHKTIVKLYGHSDPVISITFSPDGKRLASGSVDLVIILWDMKTYQPIGSLSGNPAPVQSLVFSPDGKTLASASSTDITLWDANEQLWANASCQRAGRNFTRNEWEIYFPSEEYRKTCPGFALEPAVTPTATP